MNARIVIGLLLVSLGPGAFAQNKASLKTSPPSTGITIPASFYFNVMGDGISTTLALTPWKVPQTTYGLPTLPLLGSSGGSCSGFQTSIAFTATVSGHQLLITLASPVPAGQTYNCSTTLILQPQ